MTSLKKLYLALGIWGSMCLIPLYAKDIHWEDVPSYLGQAIHKQQTTVAFPNIQDSPAHPNGLPSVNVALKLQLLASKPYVTSFEYLNLFGHNTQYSYYPNDFKLDSLSYTFQYKNSKEDCEKIDAWIAIKHKQWAGITKESDIVWYSYLATMSKLNYGKLAKSDTDIENMLKERNIYLGLQGKPVVCDAYALLLGRLLDSYNIENYIVIGKGANISHGWNLVKLENTWYHLDATWGDSPSLAEQKKYFLKSDFEMLSLEHTWDTTQYPKAPYKYSKTRYSNQVATAIHNLETQINNQSLSDKTEVLQRLYDLKSDILIIEDKQTRTQCLVKVNTLIQGLK